MQPVSSPSLSLSQNFLTSRAVVDRLLTASSIGTGDLVLDLGAGSGIIAERLAQRGCDVVAVEKDPGLAHLLTVRFAHAPLVRVYGGDVREMTLPHRPHRPYGVPGYATRGRLAFRRPAPGDAYRDVAQAVV